MDKAAYFVLVFSPYVAFKNPSVMYIFLYVQKSTCLHGSKQFKEYLYV